MEEEEKEEEDKGEGKGGGGGGRRRRRRESNRKKKKGGSKEKQEKENTLCMHKTNNRFSSGQSDAVHSIITYYLYIEFPSIVNYWLKLCIQRTNDNSPPVGVIKHWGHRFRPSVPGSLSRDKSISHKTEMKSAYDFIASIIVLAAFSNHPAVIFLSGHNFTFCRRYFLQCDYVPKILTF